MPKRKSDDNYEKILKKIKKLEKRLRRHRRSRSSRSASRSRSPDNRTQEQEQGVYTSSNQREIPLSNVAELLDGGTDLELVTCDDTDVVVGRTTATATAAATNASVTSAEPAVSAATTDNIAQPTVCGEQECTDAIPDSMLLEILGDDPTISNNYGAEIHRDLAVRLEHSATHGLTKELRKELIEKYLVPTNCRLIGAPALNPEIRAAMSDLSIKRDKNIEQRQKHRACTISCLGQAINKQIHNNNPDPELTKILMDSERILCDAQYNDSVLRRNFILSALKKDLRDQLQNTMPDNLLFGQNLSETIRTAKAINKSGADLRTPAPKPQANNTSYNKKPPATPSTSKNLNWKGPNVVRKQPNHPRTKGPPANNRPSSSSRQSRHQPATRSRR